MKTIEWIEYDVAERLVRSLVFVPRTCEWICFFFSFRENNNENRSVRETETNRRRSRYKFIIWMVFFSLLVFDFRFLSLSLSSLFLLHNFISIKSTHVPIDATQTFLFSSPDLSQIEDVYPIERYNNSSILVACLCFSVCVSEMRIGFFR